ncbi:sugar phosphate isomerase/epimerase family protein, partial [Bryobacter aggregatus]|uniref:sugar phosphate isomerase/epimerase family protein n=1 Tax=Bryobacter aggregatus TaxID=360054 RepID=UPI0004E254F6
MDRRSFLAAAAATTLAQGATKPVVGLELYSVRNELAKDLPGTLSAVAKMGYEGVEFFGPYADWKPEYAKEVKKQLDDLGMPCLSAHTGVKYFTPPELARVIELNVILGSKYMIMSSAGRVTDIDGWKGIATTLNAAAEQLRKIGKGTGFHNHAVEWKAIGGVRPMDVLAAETAKDVVLQLDVGTAIESNVDPVDWIKKNPGRIKSMHMKDWKSGMATPHEGYRVLLGDGDAKWKDIVAAARAKGGVEHLLVEQEGSALPPLETAKKCLENYKRIVG